MDYATLGTRNETQMVQINLAPHHSYRKVWNSDNVELYRSNFMNTVLFYPAGLFRGAVPVVVAGVVPLRSGGAVFAGHERRN